MNLKGVDIVSATQFAREDIGRIFQRADDFAAELERGAPARALDDKTLAMLFYEPSAHTRQSFEDAMQRLGGNVVAVAKTSALAETIATVRADALVLRHPATGAAQIAADAAAIPVVNAGDGTGEHPTEALAQLYALRAEKQTIDGLRIALVGDLKNGRVAHSLALLLAQFDVNVSLVAPAPMSMPYDISDSLRAHGLSVEETNDLPRVLEKADAVILARVEQKYWSDAKLFEKMRGFFSLENIVAQKRAGTWLAGTWEGGEEILAEAYRQTSASGLAVRMALLAEVIASRSHDYAP